LLSDLTTVLTSAVPGVKTAANRLSTIGVTINDKGRLELDKAKLGRVLGGQEPGVSLADVKRMFALTGTSSNDGVSFLLGSDKTKPTPAGQPYQVNVTAPATRGAVTAASPPAPSVVIDSSNNSLAVVVNGVKSNNLTLTAGTYTPASLAAMLQTVLNSDPPIQANQVSVDLSSGSIRITSAKYGSASTVEMASGSALAALGFAGGEKASGTNVAGSFTVGGKTEAAEGLGQVLTGSSGNANTDGLQVLVTAPAATTGDLDVTQGVASRLNAVLNKYLDPVNGRFKTLDNGYDTDAADIDKTIARQNALIDAKKESLLKQFSDMETAVSRLKNLGTQLSSFAVTKYS
jgi:flagellar hook-associated protein 2